MTEKIVGNCPHCGKRLEIPGDLQEFSCLYCGQRTHIDLLRAQESFREEELRELASQLPQTLREHSELFKHMNRQDYVPTFEAYEKEHSVLLRRLDLVVSSAPMGVNEASKLVCQVFMDTLSKDLKEVKGRRSSQLLYELKVAIALFLTPLVRKLNLRMAEPFRKELHSCWMEHYPNESWTAGDYDQIAGGFRRKGLCFITTATCAHEGKPDDCAELTAFRAFRDGWLLENGGAELIREYYDIAPSLVTLMEHCDTADRCYEEIRCRWLEPCLEALEKQEYSACKACYTDMVLTLKERYLQ